MASILIIEDDSNLSKLLSMHLEDQGHAVDCATSLVGARSQLAASPPNLVLLDHQLPDGHGLDLLPELKRDHSDMPVIMITGAADTALAIESMQRGAYDFIRKPMDQAELDAVIASALSARRLACRPTTHAAGGAHVSINSIVGNSRAIIELCKTIGKVAATDATILITGESGTGKEVVARAIHHHSGRSGVFLPINCSAIVDTLLESELFGHEKGSFTGAVAAKQGKFEVANDGTLFLDEIGEMAPGLQAKLLRILQERRFERVGSTESQPTTARVIAATHRDLGSMVADGSFREDLYYRLNVVALHLPPLRERPEDLPPLVEHLLRKVNAELGTDVTRISAAAWRELKAYRWPGNIRELKAYRWPGNIRELENVITRAVLLARQDVLTPELLRLPGRNGEPRPATVHDDLVELVSLEDLEARHVRSVLQQTRWHKGKACEILGISRPALDRKITKHGIR